MSVIRIRLIDEKHGEITHRVIVEPTAEDCAWVADGWRGHGRSTRFYQIVRDLMLAGFCCVVMLGCGDASHPVERRKVDDSKPTPVVEERAKAADVWLSLSHAVDAGTIATTSRLAQFVLVLAKNGDLSESDVVKFDEAFPGATKNDRQLTKDDSATLKGIK